MSNGAASISGRRWLVIALLVSLALNAFFIGAAATDIFRTSKKTGYGGPIRYELRWLAGRLPAESMSRVEAAVAEGRPATEAHIERLRELRRGLGALAAAEEPDRAAIDAKLAEIRTELDLMLADAQKTTMDALLALPPEARVRLRDDQRGRAEGN
jgi:uncharacterized membrane protein